MPNRLTRFQIGKLRFLEMGPQPDFTAENTVIQTTAFQDGIAIWKDGERGMPFEMQTLIDANGDRDVAFTVQQHWRSKGTVQPIRWEWVVYGSYLVKDCRPQATQVLRLVNGLRYSNPTHIVHCRWLLVPLRNPGSFR